MKRYFPLDNSRNALYKEIGDVIKEKYPIGLLRETVGYQEHPKIIKIVNAIGDHMDNYNTYIKPWRSFLNKLPRGYKSKIHSIGMPLDLSYSGELVLEKYEDEALVRLKKIVFVVSWLTPFFTVYGIDETFIKDMLDDREVRYHAINVITTSPYKEFEDGFYYLLNAIKAEFPDCKFVPFDASMLYVKDLQTPYSDLDECSVYNALFDNSLDVDNLPIRLRGEQHWLC